MKPEEVELVRYRLARAEESLKAAHMMIEGGLLLPAVNRVYYSCFYAVSALLRTAGMASPKHSGVISLFEQHWVKTGLLPVDQGRFYRSLFRHRQRGDYDDLVTFEKSEVEQLLAGAQGFVKTVSEKVREKIADEST